MNWRELLHVWVPDDFSLQIEVGAGLVFVILVLSVVVFLFRKFNSRSLTYRETELNVTLGGIGSVKIKSNHEVAQIAHKAWSELVTRKAGLMFDPEHDVIVEVYDSWYELFAEMRSLIKEIPARQLRHRNTKKLVNLLVDSLNKGMRPHLTKWQAKFRKWYQAELEKDTKNEKTPQEIQRQYKHYKDMEQELKEINQQLVTYTNEIKKTGFLI